jgi:hypothetical protein
LSDSSDRPNPPHGTLVIRAVFVPEGETPPPEFTLGSHVPRFPATYDPATGTMITNPAFGGPGRGIQGQWHEDTEREVTDSAETSFDSNTK